MSAFGHCLPWWRGLRKGKRCRERLNKPLHGFDSKSVQLIRRDYGPFLFIASLFATIFEAVIHY
jgi:hypothetical protein